MAEKQSNKDRLKEITDSIENGIKELFESEKYKNYLRTMSRFHKYSVNNTVSNFTFDEINLMCIYNTGTRAGLMQALTDMRGQLEPDVAELLELTDSALRKLGRITDEQFAELELVPDFD